MARFEQRPCSVLDYEALAKEKLTKLTWEFYSRGAMNQDTLMDSREAFNRFRLRPHILRNVRTIHLTSSILRQPISMPLCFSPTAAHGFAHCDKEVATAKAAAHAGVVMTLSVSSTTSIDDLRSAVPDGLFWMQIYIFPDRRLTLANIRKAEKAGFKALVVTIDSNGGGAKDVYKDDYTSEFQKLEEEPSRYRLSNYDHSFVSSSEDDKLLMTYARSQVDGSNATMEDLKWLRSVTNLPLVLKGILRGDVAKWAVDGGVADGVLVSAHGGRRLDGVSAPINALSEVIQAIRGSGVEVYMDGGVRTGTDILKALALGAKAVFVGRPVLWGLSVDGEAGVRHVINILKNELVTAMRLCGISQVHEIRSNIMIHESKYLPCKL